ncbi:MAG: bifunctional allantoicase/(S)-ureidoglycine aminohydrolase [Pseudomonadota bacterium]
MSDAKSYHVVSGGLPAQTARMDGRAVFTESYAFLPASTMTDIVTSALPHWQGTRAWVLARPLSGFAETFSHYVVDVDPAGGSDRSDDADGVEAILFVVDGVLDLKVGEKAATLTAGSYAFLPPDQPWTLWNRSKRNAQFHWIRKRYQAVDGIEPPGFFVLNEQDIAPTPMPDTEGRWATTRFVDPKDMRHDMHVNIVAFQPGGVIPFLETHVMEHGLFVLEGKAAYRVNRDWIEVESGDYLWLRAFCPQACYAGGPGPFRYLLYKDVNRHMTLDL